MKILFDVLGGDNAPAAPLEGAIAALKKHPELNLVLAGPEALIRETLTKAKIDPARYEIIDAKEAVLNTDHPANFLRTKPDCSMAKAFNALKTRTDIDGMLSAGPTGALLSGCIFKAGRLKGVKRPGLITALPTRTDKLCRITDAGANMDCKPEYLVQFAKMANAYLKVTGEANPRIGLLSVGMEEGKGNELTKTVYDILKADDSINFIGNIEADKVLDGICDIVVCDGFAGNVFVKSLEGGAFYIKDLFMKAILGRPWRALGAIFQLGGLKGVKKPFKIANNAVAPLLGCSKLVVKCHGKSKAKNFEGALGEVINFVKADLVANVAKAVEETEIVLPEANA